jgi:hypothetical protein
MEQDDARKARRTVVATRMAELEKELAELRYEFNRLSGRGPLAFPKQVPTEFVLYDHDTSYVWRFTSLKKVDEETYTARATNIYDKNKTDLLDYTFYLGTEGEIQRISSKRGTGFRWRESRWGYSCTSWMCDEIHRFDLHPNSDDEEDSTLEPELTLTEEEMKEFGDLNEDPRVRKRESAYSKRQHKKNRRRMKKSN